MANNRHAYNRDVLQSYWTSDGLPLYCSQPTDEKTHTTNNVKDLPRSGKPRVTSDRDDRALQCLARWMPFAISSVLFVSPWRRNRLSSDQWILRHVLKFQTRRAKHHTKRVRRCRSSNRQPNWWSVHQKRLATSCCPPFRQPSISYKACVYGWQCQASSFKSSNRLPPKRSRDFCSLASHDPGFESHRSSVRLPGMATKSSLQSWEIHPKPLLNLHCKGQLAGCSLGYRLYFCVSKPSSGSRLHEAETPPTSKAKPWLLFLGQPWSRIWIP
jgi:hypothetical protein